MTVLLQAAGAGGASMWIMLVAMFAIIYFFMIRPQQKKQKEITNFRKTLEVNQEVITAGGIYGTIKHIDNNMVELQIANGVKINIDVNSIYALPAAADSKADKK